MEIATYLLDRSLFRSIFLSLNLLFSNFLYIKLSSCFVSCSRYRVVAIRRGNILQYYNNNNNEKRKTYRFTRERNENIHCYLFIKTEHIYIYMYIYVMPRIILNCNFTDSLVIFFENTTKLFNLIEISRSVYALSLRYKA